MNIQVSSKTLGVLCHTHTHRKWISLYTVFSVKMECPDAVFLIENYILLVMLLQLCQFSSFAPFHPAPYSLQQSPHHCSCPLIVHIKVLWLLSFIYCTLHGYSVTTYLYFLIPSPLHPFPHTPLPSGNNQNTLCIHDCLCSSCLLSLFFRFNY